MSFLIYLTILAIGFVITCFCAFFFPEYSHLWTRENDLVENLSAAFLFFAALAAVLAIIFFKRKKSTPAIFFFVNLVLFLDELSWGRKIIWNGSPKIKKIRIDSAHDLLDVFSKIISKNLDNPFFWLAIILLGGGLGLFFLRKKRFFINLISGKTKYFLAVAAILYSLSFIIDGHHGITVPEYVWGVNRVILEEYFEFGAALAMLFLSVNLLRDGWKQKKQASLDIIEKKENGVSSEDK